MADQDALILKGLQSLSKAQDTRMELYKEFDDAYKDYLVDACPPEQYHSICKIVTEGFQEVSLDVQAIERAMLDTFHRKDIATMIRRLQEAEKEKLRETATLQILSIEARKGDKDYDTTIEEKRSLLRQIQANIQDIWDEIRQEITDLSFQLPGH
ncbi:DNA repair REX1-B-domain-containing protein [Phycomyces nitens]|nr:DNA repair REX1-B-domain-containing protein [Phycomyces nitens]